MHPFYIYICISIMNICKCVFFIRKRFNIELLYIVMHIKYKIEIEARIFMCTRTVCM